MANLSVAEIQKRDGRIEILLSKLSRNDEFTTTRGKFKASLLYYYPKGKAPIIFDPSDKKDFAAAQKALNNANSTDKFIIASSTQLNKNAPLTDLIKTPEFGGKGVGGSLGAESRAMSLLKEALDEAIRENKGPITIKIKSVGIPLIVNIDKTAGTPKSDFHLINTSNEPVIWISHKEGRSPRDFQQWGGISLRVEPSINRHPETQKFIADIQRMYPDGLPPATSIYRKIRDKKLKMMAVYGNEYYTARAGPQNVDVLIQGPPGLRKVGSHYEFSANHVHYNGEDVDSEGFEPVLMAIHKPDRNDAGIPKTRIVISPIAGRKAVEFEPIST